MNADQDDLLRWFRTADKAWTNVNNATNATPLGMSVERQVQFHDWDQPVIVSCELEIRPTHAGGRIGVIDWKVAIGETEETVVLNWGSSSQTGILKRLNLARTTALLTKAGKPIRLRFPHLHKLIEIGSNY